jgi:hypothetical protein
MSNQIKLDPFSAKVRMEPYSTTIQGGSPVAHLYISPDPLRTISNEAELFIPFITFPLAIPFTQFPLKLSEPGLEEWFFVLVYNLFL